jgi:hypothetical protein
MDMITRLKSYRNGVHGEFFLDVASELETQHKLAQARLETIHSMSSYLDDLAEALGIAKPSTPAEGVGAVWKVMESVQSLRAEVERLTEQLSSADDGWIAWQEKHGLELERREHAESERDRYKAALERINPGFLAGQLVENRVVDFAAVDDPDDYDGGTTMNGIARVATALAEAVQPEICESCHSPLGDDAPLYEDADICRKCHNEIQAAEAVRG